ncbi:IGF-like family receptor 1 [Solea solea]|uniref:IGF-like family receptor 1 n=1 Tax=Solea solea TaxID=90069 RepID=UPI002729F9BA|nr:IGF-like family receptor 1 [Solea solea]XP_058503040.1 IGF-like family receptor 1 [Solea solea]XP_058503041.1 IGF-like family receptor 1 [Solea solea]XP_058503042.1 IGF-like family receptor 1 [Solea solea]XP_058503043.1 IGF-like family receptor 1 [Solea solea]
MERHSDRCEDPTTRLDRSTGQCVPCSIKPGHEVTPNCGYDDYGGRHESDFRECRDNTYNDGSRAHCRPCTPCPPGYFIIGSCNSTTDTQCRSQKTPVTESTTSQHDATFPSNAPTTTYNATSTGQTDAAGVQWEVPVILISIFLVLLSACIIYKKWTRGRCRLLCYRRKSSIIAEGFSALSAPAGNCDLDAILIPGIQSAPLQTVLDNLDVLEELVILLDPDNQKVKNTRHLASHWSFPSTQINYIYSMKDIKSPLKAVLEAVASRHPDWTVGHLATLLRKMERNDAVAVLAQLRTETLAV